MNMDALIIMFTLGLISGIGIICALIAIYGYFLTRKHVRVETFLKKELAEAREKDEQQHQYVLKKIEVAKQIITAQNKLSSTNISAASPEVEVLQAEYMRLEEQKNTIFKEILATGIDPVLNVYDPVNGSFREMKLSEIVARSAAQYKPQPTPVGNPASPAYPTGNVNITKKMNKNGKTFYLITKNNDDDVVN